MVLWPQNSLDILYDPETTGMQTSRLKLCSRYFKLSWTIFAFRNVASDSFKVRAEGWGYNWAFPWQDISFQKMGKSWQKKRAAPSGLQYEQWLDTTWAKHDSRNCTLMRSNYGCMRWAVCQTQCRVHSHTVFLIFSLHQYKNFNLQ